tara:strand:- start:369 stop:875 length:507 start_codon:yes stop_codon:yes gene_type:complete
MLTEKNILKLLQNQGFSFKIYNHEALYTVNDSSEKRGEIKGAHSKNLFLKNKKNNFFLISCLENRQVDLKKMTKCLNLGNISFAKEDPLFKWLGVRPGSVTPFGLLNDINNKVEFYLDSGFLTHETINFHPLVNTSTINLLTNDFINFLIENNKKVNIFSFDTYSLIR